MLVFCMKVKNSRLWQDLYILRKLHGNIPMLEMGNREVAPNNTGVRQPVLN